MKSRLIMALLIGALASGPLSPCPAQRHTDKVDSAILQNGWRLTPAGTYEKIGDMPLGCVLSPDHSLLAVSNAGYGDHHLYVVDPQTGKIHQTLPIARAWNGIAWSPDSATIYVSGGGSPCVHVFTKGSDGAFAPASPIELPDLAANPPEQKGQTVDKSKGKAYVSGLAISPDGKTLYTGNLATDTIYAISLPDGAIKIQRKLDANAHPYCLRLSPDGNSLYVTEGALQTVVVLGTDDLAVKQTIWTEKHPNDLLFAPDGRLFLSCGSSDCVLVVDPVTGQPTERISMALTPKFPGRSHTERARTLPGRQDALRGECGQ